jgi:hypothetical protein
VLGVASDAGARERAPIVVATKGARKIARREIGRISTNHLIAMHALWNTKRENRLQGGFRAYRMASNFGVLHR